MYVRIPYLLGDEEVVDELVVLLGVAEADERPEPRHQVAVLLQTHQTDIVPDREGLN